MTLTFRTDGNNDLMISAGRLAIVSQREAILQICAHAAKAILGEMVLAVDKGMPYFETIWVGGPTVAPFEAAFRSRILEVEGVEAIEELVIEQSQNAMRYTAQIRTIYGTGPING
jgi:hypothetical protein